MSDNWVDVAGIEDIDDEEGMSYVHGDEDIGIFNLDGVFYAIENICPHAYQQLSEGFVDGDEVECPLHNAVFHIPSGKCTKEPGRDIKTYKVKLVGNRVLVDLPVFT